MKHSKRKSRRKKKAADHKPKAVEMPKNMKKEYYWVLKLIEILERHGGWDKLLIKLDYSKRLTAKHVLYVEQTRARVLVHLLGTKKNINQDKLSGILEIANSITNPEHWIKIDYHLKSRHYSMKSFKCKCNKIRNQGTVFR